MYLEAGNTAQTKAHNEAITEAVRAEMNGEEGVPTAIMGDFNCVPNEMDSIKDMIENESWIDVGHCADWWGCQPNVSTCHQRAAAKETRIGDSGQPLDGPIC